MDMENPSLIQSPPEPTTTTPHVSTPAPASIPTPQAVVPEAAAIVAQKDHAPPSHPPQSSKSKLTPILITVTSLLAIAGLAYGVYWYQSQGDFSQIQNGVIEESIPKKDPEIQKMMSLPNQTTDNLVPSDNPIKGEAQAGYAVENQYGGYFVIINAYAISTAGEVTEISVWAPEDEVQPWDAVEGNTGMTINLATENKSDVFIQFRDSAGNTSDVITITQQMIEEVRKDI